jgi:hypothetical protein
MLGSSPLVGEKSRPFSCISGHLTRPGKVIREPRLVTLIQLILALPDQKGKSRTMHFNKDIVTLAKKHE